MMTDDARSGSRWHRGSVRDAYFLRCCPMSSSLRDSSSHYYGGTYYSDLNICPTILELFFFVNLHILLRVLKNIKVNCKYLGQ